VARRANPGLFILVRTRYVVDVDDLIALGANAVIPEEFETSVEIFSRALRSTTCRTTSSGSRKS